MRRFVFTWYAAALVSLLLCGYLLFAWVRLALHEGGIPGWPHPFPYPDILLDKIHYITGQSSFDTIMPYEDTSSFQTGVFLAALCCLGFSTTMGCRFVLRLAEERRRRTRGRCPKCNYDLRGNREGDKGCSECGWGRPDTEPRGD